MKLDIRAEYEDDCPQDVVHNHFDCPVCGKIDAATDAHCNLSEEQEPAEFGCQECGARFRYVSGIISWDAEWERIA
jgi:transcription elongation factor Elf1